MKKNSQILILCCIFATVLFGSCNNKKMKDENQGKDTIPFVRTVLESTKTSTIYEVNIRQFTQEGTFKAFEKHIPRLKELGVDILWLMPIQPIGEKNRKGSLGSAYSVKDYCKVNPDYGTDADFKTLVKTAHENGMMIIIDWVANHTAWDNNWIDAHSDWYTKDSTGNIISPVADWTDVADLNYDNKEMRAEMIKSMQFWLTNFDIDGFRCDVAMMCPTDFWNEVRPALDTVKKVFMLMEAEQTDLHEIAFDASYSWELHHAMNDISKGTKNASAITELYKNHEKQFPKDIYRMVFTSNHDENSWNGTEYERMPKSYKTFAVFTYLVPSFPLIYSGQEAGLNRRLAFFDKDSIEWKENEMTDVYTKLNKLKADNEALWNGSFGGEMVILETTAPEQIFALTREKNGNKVIAIFNLSDKEATFKINSDLSGSYKDYFTQKEMKFEQNQEIKIPAWNYFVLI